MSTSTKEKQSIKIKAKWNAEKHFAFIKICLEEKKAGNKRAHTLNRVGYKNLAKKFSEQTGCKYTQLQFKNHWDNTRKDWQNWFALKGETSMGSDRDKRTYTNTDEWWESWSKVHPGGEKFREGPIKHEGMLMELFLGSAAIGKNVHIPCFSVISNEERRLNVLTSEGAPQFSAEINVDCIQDEEDSNNNARSKRENSREKQTKLTNSAGIESSLSEVAEALSNKSTLLRELIAKKEEQYSMGAVVKLLGKTRIVHNSPQWLYAFTMFKETASREVFVALGNPESRALWLEMEFDLSRSKNM